MTTIQELLGTYFATEEIVEAVAVIVEIAPHLPTNVRKEALDIAIGSPEGLLDVANQLKGQL